MKPREQEYELRLVEWIDSSGMPGWNDYDETDNHGFSRCESVGFVVREDETQVMLAAGIDHQHGNVCDVTSIPKVAITSEKTLKV